MRFRITTYRIFFIVSFSFKDGRKIKKEIEIPSNLIKPRIDPFQHFIFHSYLEPLCSTEWNARF